MSVTPKHFSDRLLAWFDAHGRKDLPWQQNKTPYRVWVSEIMLQQTQVGAVIDYYQRFMARFPTLEDLALAPQDDVLEYWAGLGYYARARNLHRCAQTVYHDHAGQFPTTLAALVALPGIGTSTAGAILSLAMAQRGVILDGNVKRVLCRHQAIAGWPGKREVEKRLWTLADALTPQHRNADYTQAIMDLGATLCTRSRPACERCPMQEDCLAKANGAPQHYPTPKPKKTVPHRQTWIALLCHNDAILLEKRPDSGIWGGLYSLPEFPADLSEQALHDQLAAQGFRIRHVQAGTPFWHTFSHFKLELKPLEVQLTCPPNHIADTTGMHWVPSNRVTKLGLPAPISRYLAQTLFAANAIR